MLCVIDTGGGTSLAAICLRGLFAERFAGLSGLMRFPVREARLAQAFLDSSSSAASPLEGHLRYRLVDVAIRAMLLVDSSLLDYLESFASTEHLAAAGRSVLAIDMRVVFSPCLVGSRYSAHGPRPNEPRGYLCRSRRTQ